MPRVAPVGGTVGLVGSLSIATVALLVACGSPRSDPQAVWRPLEQYAGRLPEGLRIFSFTDERFPLRAWCVRADLSDPALSAGLVVSDQARGKETCSSLAEQADACVLVNAGFFDMKTDPAQPQGLLLVDGELVSPPDWRLVCLGIDAEGRADIAWTEVRDGELFERPVDTLALGSAARRPATEERRPWSQRDAIASSPALIFAGVPYRHDSTARHPRTAAGITADGELVLLVVDGRQRTSRGVTFAELAELMLELGCVEALALDGGGSSTLVVLGERLNRPAGKAEEREVASALALRCDATAR